jgi:RND superfamily putative drug exporter
MTGAEGFAVDLAAVFKGANFTLLLTTVVVVAVLLIVTYRSPWLWLVPLAVVGIADAVAGTVAGYVSSAFGVELDASITGILSVLVFGAGTNYSLLLIARYRDELRLHEDRREAMAAALKGAGPAIIASGSTVVLSLGALVFAELSGNRTLGLACAAGRSSCSAATRADSASSGRPRPGAPADASPPSISRAALASATTTRTIYDVLRAVMKWRV